MFSGSYEEDIDRLLRARLALARGEVEALAAGAQGAADLLVEDDQCVRPAGGRSLPKGHLFLHGFPEVFERFLKQRATFSPATDAAPPSACIRFIQQAYCAFGKDPPTDSEIMSARKRTAKVNGPRAPNLRRRGP